VVSRHFAINVSVPAIKKEQLLNKGCSFYMNAVIAYDYFNLHSIFAPVTVTTLVLQASFALLLVSLKV